MASAAPAPPHWLDGPSRFRQAVGYSVGLAIARLVSYWLITRILAHIYSVSRLDDLLGGMWAVIATVFVYRNSYTERGCPALAGRCHLDEFPALSGVSADSSVPSVGPSGADGCRDPRRDTDGPDDSVTTAITTTVVMVIAAISSGRD
jgi:hypothetical protein